MKANKLTDTASREPSTATTVIGDQSQMPRLLADAWQYQLDFWQRGVLFIDTLRERANNAIEHEQAGLPPLLDFEYETILDARTFARPANYALLRIIAAEGECADDCVDENNRPVIVIDPRAGHGPGIGGFKRDSEIGIAMHEGHPTYFVSFFPEPCRGQTLGDVLQALRHMVEEVSRRHGNSAPPALYGNCQAGWAVALLSADCPGLAGPAVLNGSPLSYWSGEAGVNPMRLAGGLWGGAWLTHFIADLGNGCFDGAWLGQNFELLNPANAFWDKYYHLFANIDDERERFLHFERWWNGFYQLSREEITAIVENLFIGNRLEQGQIQICEGCYVDLRRVSNPLLIFASGGDNITPPHQALNWIPAVFPDTAALKEAGQRIVFLLNPHIGHLGIFVSANVVRREHRAILESLDNLEALEPGLYEMKILHPTDDPDCRNDQYSVGFEECRVEDIKYESSPAAFATVRQVSEFNTGLYKTFVGPWVQAFATPWSADLLRRMHPMRTSHYLYTEKLNPWVDGIAILAQLVREQRQPASTDNPLLEMEKSMSDQISTVLDKFRDHRDQAYEDIFELLYGGWRDDN